MAVFSTHSHTTFSSAELVASALGGRKVGQGWTARCPTHDDHTPSLSLRISDNGRLLIRCHAGCPQEEVITHLKLAGLWPSGSKPGFDLSAGARPLGPAKIGGDDDSRTRAALSLWKAGQSPGGTLIETYLRSRRLRLPETPRLRFHRNLKHPSGQSWPAMIALVTRGVDDAPIGIHRTFIASDGMGKASVQPQKMMLGPCRGGAVRLAEPRELLMVGEGIETCLAAMQATGHPAWAALSTSGMRSLELPPLVREVIVLADGDDPGEAAARDCALRFRREGRYVRIARPPRGLDFNDLIRTIEPSAQEV